MGVEVALSLARMPETRYVRSRLSPTCLEPGAEQARKLQRSKSDSQQTLDDFGLLQTLTWRRGRDSGPSLLNLAFMRVSGQSALLVYPFLYPRKHKRKPSIS